MPTARYRNFNGYGFTEDRKFHYKADAEKYANDGRKHGKQMRITKEKAGWIVWYR